MYTYLHTYTHFYVIDSGLCKFFERGKATAAKVERTASTTTTAAKAERTANITRTAATTR